MYISDSIRLSLIKDAMVAPKLSSVSTEVPDICELSDSDLTLVRNHGDYLMYYEYWSESCWDAIFQKKEYENLDYLDVIHKFMSERFKPLVKSLGESVLDWSFVEEDNDLLIVKISNHPK